MSLMDESGSSECSGNRESQPDPVRQESIGDLRGRYALGDEIARGAMGAIHRGYDQQLDRELAIKVLLAEHERDQEANSRFVGEAKITGQLQHPGIVPVYEVGALDDERPFFSMKMVNGHTLATLLNQRTGTEDEQSHFLKIFEQICQAMAYAHNQRVIHRDLKPANIMVGSFGEVQVMDWGIAKVLHADVGEGSSGDAVDAPSISVATLDELNDTDTSDTSDTSSLTIHGTLLGTPGYIAPEQARGDIGTLDERADVFSLGAILCEILTGLPPYSGHGNQVIRKAWNADLKEAMDRLEGCHADPTIIMLARQCLSPNPADRPANAGEVAEWVNRYETQVQRRLREAELAKVDAVARSDAAIRRRSLYRMIVILLALHAVGVSVTAMLYKTQRQSEAQLNGELEQQKEELLQKQASLLKQQQALKVQQNETELAKETAEISASRRAELLYAADMQLAPILWERENTPTANLQRLLDGHLPQSGQTDLRGFEWHYFQSQLDGSSVTLDMPARALVLRDNAELVLVSEDSEVHIIDTATGEFKSTHPLPADLRDSRVHLSPQGEYLASLQSTGISLVECATGRKVGQIETGYEPQEPRFIDNRFLFVLGPRVQVGARNCKRLVRVDTRDWSTLEVPFPEDYVWAESPREGREQGTYFGIVHPRQPNQSRVGLVAASVTDGQAKLDLHSRIVPFGGASIGAWTFNADQSLLVAGQSMSGEVVVVDLQNAENQKVTLQHASVMSACALSKDCRYVATGTSNGLIKLWAIRRLDEKIELSYLRTFKGHLSAISFLAFSSDGQRLVSSDGKLTKSWELQSAAEKAGSFQHVVGTCYDLAFSPDGQWYAVADAAQDHIEIRNTDSSEVQWSQKRTGPPVVSVAFSADGRHVAFGHQKSRVTVADVQSGERVLEWEGNNQRLSVISMDFSADGNSLACGFGITMAHNTAIRVRPQIIEVDSGRKLMTLEAHENACSQIEFAPDGKTILTASHFGTLMSWALKTGGAERLFENPGNPSLPWGSSLSGFSIAPDGKTIAIGSEGGAVYLLDAESRDFRRFSGHSAAVKSVAFSHDGKTLASGSVDGTVRLWHVTTGREMVVFTTGLHHLFVRFSPDGKRLVAGGIDELKSGSPVRAWSIQRDSH